MDKKIGRSFFIGFLNIIIVILVIWQLQGCLFVNDDRKTTSKQIFAMDTYMKIEATGRNSDEAINAAAEEIYRLDKLLSTGSDSSEVTILNQNQGGSLSYDTKILVEKSIEINEITDGAFDITIYPVMREWGFTDQNFKVPDEDILKNILLNVDASKLELNEDILFIPDKMEIDLGGIAKGYTSQRVVDIYQEYGIESGLINLGGNIQTIGLKPDGSKWKIGIEDPLKNGNYLGAIEVTERAVVTSGGYERFFEENGIRYHHIIDPSTGYPAYNGLQSVTIVCEDGTLADALSTSLFIMGEDKAIAFWREELLEFDFIIYTDDGKLLVSEGLRNAFWSNYKFDIVEK